MVFFRICQSGCEDSLTFAPQYGIQSQEAKIRSEVPTDYLLEGDSILLQRGKEDRVKVISGTRNGEWVEVKKGIQAGDIITKSN